ncbi:MAG TPA: hypothetical protein VFY97_01655 [Rhodanobacteraceae bacterium]|nr:hypothetical protein [Rhodanobacteraceae bacterium]
MDAYQRLIEDSPARPLSGRSRRGGEKAVREAVAGVPLANPAQAVQEVEQILDGMLATAWSGGDRIAALAHLQAPVASLCHGIEQHLGVEAQPLPPASAARAATAQRLQWKLARNAATGLHELCAPSGKLPMFKGKLGAGAVLAGLAHAGQALVWAYRQYQAPAAGVWRLIHGLYGFACELGVADQAVDDPLSAGRSATARTVYAQTLLLAMSNPYRFSARELKEACAIICCVAGLCVLTRAGGQGVSVDADSDAGPGYVAEERLAAGSRTLDVQPAQRVIDERIAMLPNGAEVVDLLLPGGGVVGTSVGFLRRLLAGWGTAERGHARLAASHDLDLVVGMHALHYALAGNMDFATFVRQVHGEAITVSRHTLASAWLAASDAVRPQTLRGEVLDQSEGGYRLRLQESDGARLRIGEVVGLSPVAEVPDERDWMVGVIRWLRLEDGGGLLGVELLYRTARAAGIRPVTVDGETMVPQRAVELPGQAGPDQLALLVTNHFARNVTAVEVALPALASDWRASAAVDVWRCDGAETLGTACVRVNLVRNEASATGRQEGGT